MSAETDNAAVVLPAALAGIERQSCGDGVVVFELAVDEAKAAGEKDVIGRHNGTTGEEAVTEQVGLEGREDQGALEMIVAWVGGGSDVDTSACRIPGGEGSAIGEIDGLVVDGETMEVVVLEGNGEGVGEGSAGELGPKVYFGVALEGGGDEISTSALDVRGWGFGVQPALLRMVELDAV